MKYRDLNYFQYGMRLQCCSSQKRVGYLDQENIGVENLKNLKSHSPPTSGKRAFFKSLLQSVFSAPIF
jgi:hypothetical protein